MRQVRCFAIGLIALPGCVSINSPLFPCPVTPVVIERPPVVLPPLTEGEPLPPGVAVPKLTPPIEQSP